MIEALPPELINDLQKAAELMVSAGFEKEFSDVYISCRMKCLEECLINKLFESQEINIENEDDMVKYLVIRRWTTASEVALRILFPFEQQLCEQVFSGFSTVAARCCFTEVCQGAIFQLLNFADAAAQGSASTWRLFKMLAIFETLSYLIPKFQSLFPDSSVNEAIVVNNRLGEATSDLFVKLNYLIFHVPVAKQVVPTDGQHHQMTALVMSYLAADCRSRRMLRKFLQYYPEVSNRVEASFSFTTLMEWMMETLETYLIGKSKNYKNLALRYIFMMNNRWYIEANNKGWDLGTFLGHDWFQQNQEKIQQDLELYQRSSWNKVLDFLELDNNDNVTAELLEDRLNSFNRHFKEICRVQSTWSVNNKKLREKIIASVGNTLLPAYGIFIGRLQDILGNHAYKYIEYGIFEIQDKLNNLFQGNNIGESSEFR